MANQDRLYIIVLLRWGSRTRILSLFRRRTIPGFSSDAAQAKIETDYSKVVTRWDPSKRGNRERTETEWLVLGLELELVVS